MLSSSLQINKCDSTHDALDLWLTTNSVTAAAEHLDSKYDEWLIVLLHWRTAVQLSGTPITVGSREGPSVPMLRQAANAWVQLQGATRDVAIPNLQTAQMPTNETPGARFLIELTISQPSSKPPDPNVFEVHHRRYDGLAQENTKQRQRDEVTNTWTERFVSNPTTSTIIRIWNGLLLFLILEQSTLFLSDLLRAYYGTYPFWLQPLHSATIAAMV